MQQVLLLILIFLAWTASEDINNVKLVQILFRHGERSPTRSYTNDPYKNYSWPGGFNQLTNRGKRQLFDLGKEIKKRYKDAFDHQYNPNKVLVYSSYADRCQMSAQLLLAGLYPPENSQIWNPDLLWQPIPVHTIPRSLDNKIALKKKCAKYEMELESVYNSERVQELNKKNGELYEYLTTHTGEKVDSVRQVEVLYNTFEIQKLNNLSLPDWTSSIYNENMKYLATQSLALFTETEYMKRMHGGMLIKEIIETMENKTKRIPLEMKLYSGHDLTIVSILNCLRLELVKPEFGASILFELHLDDVIKVFYKSNSHEEAILLKLPFCNEMCKLSEFKKAMSPIIPLNWDDECLV